MRKKVLLVVRWPVGGIRTFIRYVYRNFDGEIWNLTILGPNLPEMQVLMQDLTGYGVNFILTDEEPNPRKFFQLVASEVLWGNYDLVHSHGFTSGICTALVAAIGRLPHLLTSHDVINAKQFRGPIGRIKKLIMFLMLNFVDIIQSVSNDAQVNLKEHFPFLVRRIGKCVVIANGVEVERFGQAEPRQLRAELGVADNVFLIGFMGRFMAQKGFRYLVDAIELIRDEKELPKRPLVLSFGEGGFIREEIQSIKERGLEDSFCFMPFAPNVASTIKGLDVVAMPSLWEACGLLAMETLVCGVPLIGTDCIGLREVLEGTPAKVVARADTVGLANMLKQEMKNSSKDHFMIFSDTASEKFDVRKTSREIMNLYGTMIGSKT